MRILCFNLKLVTYNLQLIKNYNYCLIYSGLYSNQEQKNMKLLGSLFIILALAYIVILLFVYFTQERMIFFPVPAQPELYKQHDEQEYHLTINQETLQGWRVENPDATTRHSIIYFGGNAEDVFFNLADADLINAKQLFFTNFRGYGNSSGQPSEQALLSDSLAIYDQLVEHYQLKPEQTVIMGRSLGSSVAAYLASQRANAGLILITPFDSVQNVAAYYYQWLPVRWMLKHKFDTTKYIPEVKSPILLLNAEYDEVIPKHNFNQLEKFANSNAKSQQINNTNHQTIGQSAEYFLHINHFLNHL